MPRQNCGRCCEPTPATTVERVGYGNSSYDIPLCEDHANALQRAIYGWTRCGVIVDDAPVPARPVQAEPAAPREWRRIELPPAIPAQPAARVRRYSTLQPPLAFAPPPQREPRPAPEHRTTPEHRTAELELDLGQLAPEPAVGRDFKVQVPPPLTPTFTPPTFKPPAFTNPFGLGAPEPTPDAEPATDPIDLSGFGNHRAGPRPGHPLPDDWQRWRFTDHATQRRRERRVSPAEVLWAACHPDVVRPGENSVTVVHIREHVHVVLNPSENAILTVVNRRLNTQEGTFAHVAS